MIKYFIILQTFVLGGCIFLQVIIMSEKCIQNTTRSKEEKEYFLICDNNFEFYITWVADNNNSSCPQMPWRAYPAQQSSWS